MPENRSTGRPKASPAFDTTEWTVVLEAADSEASNFQEALGVLCETYWYPLYAFIRRRGYDRAQAEDLLQGFFARLLDKGDLRMADPNRGRFRTFLLVSVKNYIANQHDHERALKRGGGLTHMSLDFDDGEHRFSFEPPDLHTPEEVYERRWALTHIDHALGRLKEEMEQAGHDRRYELLHEFLTESRPDLSYTDAAAALELKEGAARVAVHRMRKRFGEILREQVAQTLADRRGVDEEMRHLLEVVGA